MRRCLLRRIRLAVALLAMYRISQGEVHSRKEEYLCVPWSAMIDVERVREFLPEMVQVSNQVERDLDAEALRERLRILGKCRRPFVPIGGRNAFGSHVNSLIFPLTYAIEKNRTFLSPSLGAYANATCVDWSCIFRSTAPACDQKRVVSKARRLLIKKKKKCPPKKVLFTCDYPELQARGFIQQRQIDALDLLRFSSVEKIDKNIEKDPCAVDGICSVPALRASALKKGKYSYGMHNDHAIPLQWRHRGHFWFVSQLLSWLLRPNVQTKAYIQQAIKVANIHKAPRPLLAIHIRRGDACLGTQPKAKMRTCDSFYTYWLRALQMRDKYNIKSVFIASDDPIVFINASQAATRDNLPVFFIPPSSRQSFQQPTDRNWDILLNKARQQSQQPHSFSSLLPALATDIFSDIALLARCDAFLGKFTSNIDRIAYALLTAHARCLKPYISLDASWCHDWSNRIGNSIYGTFLC